MKSLTALNEIYNEICELDSVKGFSCDYLKKDIDRVEYATMVLIQTSMMVRFNLSWGSVGAAKYVLKKLMLGPPKPVNHKPLANPTKVVSDEVYTLTSPTSTIVYRQNALGYWISATNTDARSSIYQQEYVAF